MSKIRRLLLISLFISIKTFAAEKSLWQKIYQSGNEVVDLFVKEVTNASRNVKGVDLTQSSSVSPVVAVVPNANWFDEWNPVEEFKDAFVEAIPDPVINAAKSVTQATTTVVQKVHDNPWKTGLIIVSSLVVAQLIKENLTSKKYNKREKYDTSTNFGNSRTEGFFEISGRVGMKSSELSKIAFIVASTYGAWKMKKTIIG